MTYEACIEWDKNRLNLTHVDLRRVLCVQMQRFIDNENKT